MRISHVAIVVCMSFGAAADAFAAMSVVGTPQIVQCFETANAGVAETVSCDQALADPDLLGRDRVATLVNRGIILNVAGKYERAIADFDAALELDVNTAEAYLNRGNSLIYLHRINDAIADYDKAIDLHIDRLAAAYYNRALAYGSLGKFAEAKADLEAALKVDPDFQPASEQLAVVNHILGTGGAGAG